MQRLAISALGLLIGVGVGSACPSGTEAAELCGAIECPVGTSPNEKRTSSMTYDIELGFDPATYDASGAFKSFGEGECEYFCTPIQACPTEPELTFPVITRDCFTCGVVDYDSNGDPVVNTPECMFDNDTTDSTGG